SGARHLPVARLRRQAPALFRGAAPRRGELALGDVGEPGAARRHGREESDGLSARHHCASGTHEGRARGLANTASRRTADRNARYKMTRSSMVTICEHKIPSADSKPYIAVEGPDGCLWFCESGASKIGRFDPDRGTFAEFALPTTNATPIGIAAGADGNL